MHDFLWVSIEIGIDPDLDGFDDMEIYIPTGYDTLTFTNGNMYERANDTIQTLIRHSPGCLGWRDVDGLTPLHY